MYEKLKVKRGATQRDRKTTQCQVHRVIQSSLQSTGACTCADDLETPNQHAHANAEHRYLCRWTDVEYSSCRSRAVQKHRHRIIPEPWSATRVVPCLRQHCRGRPSRKRAQRTHVTRAWCRMDPARPSRSQNQVGGTEIQPGPELTTVNAGADAPQKASPVK